MLDLHTSIQKANSFFRQPLPDNYDDNVDYIVIKEGDIILK